ncbi:hypothetical protein [Microbacterium sp.]|uniref:hypothetical protein n=1 Tax=Microbacterium sp. TaxID=51671 RepID=UPI0039E3321D
MPSRTTWPLRPGSWTTRAPEAWTCDDGDVPEHAAAAAADGAIVYVNSGAYFAGSAGRRASLGPRRHTVID